MSKKADKLKKVMEVRNSVTNDQGTGQIVVAGSTSDHDNRRKSGGLFRQHPSSH